MPKLLPVAIDLPVPLILALGQAARTAGQAPSDFLTLLIAEALDRCGASPPATADIVRHAVQMAADWLDLQRRLRRAGFVLRQHEEGQLWLHDWPMNRPLLPLAALGHTLATLTLAFRAPFPAEPFVPSQRRVARRDAA